MTHLSTFAYKAGTETDKEGQSEYAFSPVELPADTDRQTDTQIRIQTEPQAEIELEL